MTDDDPFCVCGCRASEHCQDSECCGPDYEPNPENQEQYAGGGFCVWGCNDCGAFEWPRGRAFQTIASNMEAS